MARKTRNGASTRVHASRVTPLDAGCLVVFAVVAGWLCGVMAASDSPWWPTVTAICLAALVVITPEAAS